MKNFNIILLILACLGFNSKAQNSVSLQTFINSIDQSGKQEKPVTNSTIKFELQWFNTSISNYSYSKNNLNFSLSDNDNLDKMTFHLVQKNGDYHGMLLDETKEFGYKIKRGNNNQVEYVLTPKNELLFVCNIHDETHDHAKSTAIEKPIYIGNENTATSVLDLESKPGATNLIYLDFDGEPSLPGWSKVYYTSNYSTDAILKNWQNAAEDFIPFDVNVTTNRALFDAHPDANKGWVVLADFQNNSWGGLAYLNSFGTGKPVLVDGEANGVVSNFLLMAVSHELGHSLGLSHDGKSGGGSAYYAGHGDYSPIMGNGSRPVSHWSKGEYTGATNTEDDLNMITGYLGLRPDDAPTAKDLFVFVNDSVFPIYNNGMIESNTDIDTFRFELSAAGQVDFIIKSSITYTNLDVVAKIIDNNLQVISTVNPSGDRSATINEYLQAGKYYLTIEGGSELTVNTGYSDYSSFGYYEILGKVENHQLDGDDIVLLDIDNMGSVCSDKFSPSIEVMNNGGSTINSFSIDVLIDGVLDHTETSNTTILSGETVNIQLNDITNTGTHQVTIELDMSGLESITSNNSSSSSYTLKNGNLLSFSTDLLNYTGSNPIPWEIKDASGGAVVVTSSSLITKDNSTSVSQDYCINPGCYEVEMTGDFNLCNNIPVYSNSATYVLDDVVYHNGGVYRAKWWTQGTPPPSQAWELTGSCNSGPYNYSLTDTYQNNIVMTGNSNSFNGSHTESFCINLPTIKNEIIQDESITIYPNPNTGNFKIRSIPKNSFLEIYDGQGKLIDKKSIAGDQIEVNIPLHQGLYYAVIKSEKSTISKSFLVR